MIRFTRPYHTEHCFLPTIFFTSCGTKFLFKGVLFPYFGKAGKRMNRTVVSSVLKVREISFKRFSLKVQLLLHAKF